MEDNIQYGECRFCGQQIQIVTDVELTLPQSEEEATMLCRCQEAQEYQKEKIRKEKALKNVSILFGNDAPYERRIGEGITDILNAAVEQIYHGGVAKVVLNMRGGVKATVSQNSKGEINVERTETRKQKLTE